MFFEDFLKSYGQIWVSIGQEIVSGQGGSDGVSDLSSNIYLPAET